MSIDIPTYFSKLESSIDNNAPLFELELIEVEFELIEVDLLLRIEASVPNPLSIECFVSNTFLLRALEIVATSCRFLLADSNVIALRSNSCRADSTALSYSSSVEYAALLLVIVSNFLAAVS